VEVLDADGPQIHRPESGIIEQCQNLRKIDVAVPVPEMRRKAPHLRLGPGEVDQEYPAAGLDNPPQLGCKLSTGVSAEVMQHHRATCQIEARVGKWKRLRGGMLESDLDACPRRFGPRPGQHFRRGIDAADHC
jgi:hypothetical protein